MTTLYRATNLTIDNFYKNPNRFYLEDFFVNKPIEKANAGGSGISSKISSKVYYDGMDIVTVLYVNLIGCSVNGNNTILGLTPGEPGYLTQLTSSKNGYVYSVSISCPISLTTGEANIDLEKKSSSINVHGPDTGTTIVLNDGNWTIGKAAKTQSATGAAPFDNGFVNDYIFLVSGNAVTDAYTAGELIINLRGINPSSSLLPLETNMSFELTGTNAISLSQSSTQPGIELTTAGADNDQAIIQPTVNNTSSAWTSTLWGTEDSLEYECCIITDSSISNMAFWSGLKLTSTGAYATDANQAYFLYSTNSDLGNLTTNANLHFVYSVGGTDYVTDLGLALAVSTKYILKLNIDSDRKIRIYVNETPYGLATTSVAGGTTQTTTTQKSNALTNNIDLIPYTGVQSLSAAANTITLSYVKLSKDI